MINHNEQCQIKKRRSISSNKFMNQNNNHSQNADFQDDELSQLDHSSFQKVHINQNKSKQQSQIYFNNMPMRQYIQLDEYTKPILLRDNEQVVQNIREVISGLFNEINFHENSLLVCNDSLRNKYIIFFHNCDLQPFSVCCNQPVFVELDKFGKGSIKCHNNVSLCPLYNNNIGKQFLVNLYDQQNKGGNNNSYIEDDNRRSYSSSNNKQLNQKYSKEISKRVINGSYKVFNVQERIKKRNKSIKQFIDSDIYQSTQFQHTSQDNSIQSINVKSISNTYDHNISTQISKPPKQNNNYQQKYLKNINLSSLNVDNLVDDQIDDILQQQNQNQDNINSQQNELYHSNLKNKSYKKGEDNNNSNLENISSRGYNTTNNNSLIRNNDEQQFIPSAFRKRLMITPDRVQQIQKQQLLPNSKLSEYSDIQPLKDIQYTKEFKTLQKIRQRIKSVTGQSPVHKRGFDFQQQGQDQPYYSGVNDYKHTQHLKTQISGQLQDYKKPIYTSTDDNPYIIPQNNNRSKSNQKYSNQLDLIDNSMINYTNQRLDNNQLSNHDINDNNKSQISNQRNKEKINKQINSYSNQSSFIQQQQGLSCQQLENEDEQYQLNQKQHLIKHSFTPQMYNDYKIQKNEKYSPKHSNNNSKPSLTPFSPRTANDHNKLHVFKSVLRKQLKPYRDMYKNLGATPQIQVNQIGNYRSTLQTQKSIIQTLI